jgi:hypothetical protein
MTFFKSCLFVIVFFLSVFFLLTAPETSHAQDNGSLEEVMEGFDDEQPSDVTVDEVLEGFDAPAEQEKPVDTDIDEEILQGFEDDESVWTSSETGSEPSPVELDGYLKLGTSYNFAHDAPRTNETDWREFSRLRGEIQLELSADLGSSWDVLVGGKGAYDAICGLKGRDDYTDDVLENYEKELEFRETYIRGSLTKSLDLKLGRQIVVWGKSDNIRVTDVLNPLDLREPGLTDIEDLRLPVTMTRLDYYIGKWSLTGIALHEIRFNKNPEYGSDFYPATAPLPHEAVPSHSLENTEYALAAGGIFSGWDIAFYFADIFNDLPHMETKTNTGNLELKHARYLMAGSAFNAALGNWLVKAEVAYFHGIEFFNAPKEEYSRVDALVGFEYSGFKDTTVSIEAVNRHLNNFDPILERYPDQANEDEFQTALRLERDFRNETLKLTLLAITFGLSGQDGALQRFSAEYDVTDAIQIAGGVVFYQSGDLSLYENIGDNDRLFFEIKYSF